MYTMLRRKNYVSKYLKLFAHGISSMLTGCRRFLRKHLETLIESRSRSDGPLVLRKKVRRSLCSQLLTYYVVIHQCSIKRFRNVGIFYKVNKIKKEEF